MESTGSSVPLKHVLVKFHSKTKRLRARFVFLPVDRRDHGAASQVNIRSGRPTKLQQVAHSFVPKFARFSSKLGGLTYPNPQWVLKSRERCAEGTKCFSRFWSSFTHAFTQLCAHSHLDAFSSSSMNGLVGPPCKIDKWLHHSGVQYRWRAGVWISKEEKGVEAAPP